MGVRHATISSILSKRMHEKMLTEPELAIYMCLDPTFLHYLLMNMTCVTSLVTPATIIHRGRWNDFDRETREATSDIFDENEHEAWHAADQFSRADGKQPQLTRYHVAAFISACKYLKVSHLLPDPYFRANYKHSHLADKTLLPVIVTRTKEVFKDLAVPLRDSDVLEFLRLFPSRSPEYGIR